MEQLENMRVLFVFTKDSFPCTVKCSIELSSALSQAGVTSSAVSYTQLNDLFIINNDIIILQRLGADIQLSESDINNILNLIEKYYDTKKFVYMLDDMLVYTNCIIQKFIQRCHAVICFNTFMASLLQQYNSNIYVMKTFVDLKTVNIIRSNIYNKFTLVWASSDPLGFEFMVKLLSRISAIDKYQTICITKIRKNRKRRLNFKNVASTNIKPFIELTRIIKGASILLNPVILDLATSNHLQKSFGMNGNDFINCKAEIKYAIAGATRACLLTSKTHPYIEAIQDRKNGVLLSDNVDEWVEAINELYDNYKLKEEYVNSAYQDVSQNYSFEAAAKKMIEILNQIVKVQ